jgi:hypothetical protein
VHNISGEESEKLDYILHIYYNRCLKNWLLESSTRHQEDIFENKI